MEENAPTAIFFLRESIASIIYIKNKQSESIIDTIGGGISSIQRQPILYIVLTHSN